jgi:hypothetical protein
MTAKMNTTDPDIRGSLPAIKRAARRARALGKATGTPVYALKGGRVVNINANPRRRGRKPS